MFQRPIHGLPGGGCVPGPAQKFGQGSVQQVRGRVVAARVVAARAIHSPGEAIAHGDARSSRVVGRAIGDIDLPSGTTIGAIVRGKEVLIAHDDGVVESGDHVILFVIDKRRIRDVERLFQVGLTFF